MNHLAVYVRERGLVEMPCAFSLGCEAGTPMALWEVEQRPSSFATSGTELKAHLLVLGYANKRHRSKMPVQLLFSCTSIKRIYLRNPVAGTSLEIPMQVQLPHLIDQNGEQVCSACGMKFPIDSKPSVSKVFIAHVGTYHKLAQEKPVP